MKDERVWVMVGLAALAAALSSCSKSEVQAPAKEAPTSVSTAAPAEPRGESAAPGAPAPVQAPPPSDDTWPQAGAKDEPLLEERKRQGSASGSSAPKKATERRAAQAPRPSVNPAPASEGAAESSDSESVSGAVDLLARVEQAAAQMDDLVARLDGALTLAVPDCSAAERFRTNVCSLADRICSLEQDLPRTTRRRCEDGKNRCSEASRRYRAKCGE